ncbi:MAG TPA: hypothetical protein EYP34_10185 [Chromatiaceae bacterium]|nr:hypothetical protein [Chromatiaceae bacterium]
MLTKILFTLAVAAVVFAMVRFRGRPSRSPAPPPVKKARSPWVKVLAISVVVMMLAGTAVIIYLNWRDSHQIMQVQVIDSGSGRVSTYRVYRGELQERYFVTLDGRRVQLAETERLEVVAAP